MKNTGPQLGNFPKVRAEFAYCQDVAMCFD